MQFSCTWGMQPLCTSPFNINEEIGLSVLFPHICSPARKTIPQALGSEHTNRFLKWNRYRSRNLILQLITSNIWKEKSYCVSALPPLRWAAGIKHIRKWNVCKSLKRRSWPKLHFKEQENLDERWEKKSVQLLKNGKHFFYVSKVTSALRQKGFKCRHHCIHDFKNFSRNRIIIFLKFWLLKNFSSR